MKLTVVIVNYNVKYFLEQCLHSCLLAAQHVETEIYVVDNNSVDGSVEMVQEKFPQVTLIANKENTGFSKANNQAIKITNGKYVLLLNPDTIVEETTFKQTVDFMEANPKAGGLGVKMVDGKGNFLPESKRGLPTPAVAFYKIFGLSALFPKSKKFGQYHLGYLPENKVNEVDILAGAFMLLRKEVLDKIGLLDESFFMYGEDIDLSYRITKAGYKNYYFPESTIIHYKGESTKKSSINYVFVFYNAMVIFAKKHFSEKNAQAFSFLINIAIYLRAAVAVFMRFARKAFIPAIDFALFLTGLFTVKAVYQDYTSIVYTENLLAVAFPAYSLLWVLAILINGGYDKPFRFTRLITGILSGTAIILIFYALLPETYRFSRALILLGATWALVSFAVSRPVLHWLKLGSFALKTKKQKRFAIVGKQEEVKRVKGLLQNSKVKPETIACVHPNDSFEDKTEEKFVASIEQLSEVISIFKIDEVVFCSKDIELASIISQMATVEKTEVSFKIAPPESVFIIGSNSIDTQGDLYYVVEINAISKPSAQRNKRIFDVFFALLFLLLSPIFLVIVKNKSGFIKNIFQVLIGNKSWVGYASSNEIPLLPKIKKGVLTPLSLMEEGNIQKSTINKLNLIYARDYSLLKDFDIVWKGIGNLGN